MELACYMREMDNKVKWHEVDKCCGNTLERRKLSKSRKAGTASGL